MSDLVLAAAGGLAREAATAIRSRGVDTVVGLLDDDESRWGSLVGGWPVLGGRRWLTPRHDMSVVLCAGHGRTRSAMARRFGLAETRYAKVVDASAGVPSSCALGAGSILLAGVVFTDSVTLGRHVVVMPNVTLTHDVVVSDYVTICAGTSVGGGVSIGAGAYLGMNVSVREGVSIGRGATIGMGSVVLRDVGVGETWVGSPAHRIVATGSRSAPTRATRQVLAARRAAHPSEVS